MRCIISFFVMIMSILGSTFAHQNDNNAYTIFSDSQKQIIESKLSIFLDKVDGFDESKQKQVYTLIHERIQKVSNKYSFDSPEYTILHIVSAVLEHKLSSDIILSNEEILDHILYGIDYQHYIEEESVSEEISDTGEELEVVVRDDLNAYNLNEYEKNILAGNTLAVASIKVRADLEPIDTGIVEFRFNQDIDNIGLGGNLYLDGVLVATASSTDVDGNTLVFDNIIDLIIPKQTSYLQLEILTSSIGRDSVGELKSNILITSVALRDNKGTITGDKTGDRTYRESSRAFNIVPVILEATAQTEFAYNRGTAQLYIAYDAGGNNQNGADLQPKIYQLDLLVSSFDAPGSISIFNSRGENIGSTDITVPGRISIPLAPDNVSSKGEIYRIETTVEANFYIPQDAIKYTAGTYHLETNLKKQVFLGQY